MSKKSLITPGQAMHLERLSRALAGHKNKLPPASKRNSAPGFKTDMKSLMGQVSQLVPYAEKGMEWNKKLFGDEFATLGLILKGQKPGGILGSLLPSSSKSGVAVNTNAQLKTQSRPAQLKSSGETVMSAPVLTGVSSESRTAIHFSKAPAIPGAGEGIRIRATFLGPNIVAPRSSSSGTDASAFAKLGNSTAPAMWVHLNPGDDLYTWIIVENKGAGAKTTFAIPLMAAVPRLAAMARNFTRFRCRHVSIEYLGRLGTATPGVVRISRLDDPIKALEVPDDAVTTSGDQAFSWVSDLEKGFEFPVWSARQKSVLLEDRSKGSLTTLQYVTEGLNTAPSQPVPGQATCRQQTPCLIGAVTDVGRETGDVNKILGRTFWTVEYDFYGMVIGPQSNTTDFRAKVWDALTGSVSSIENLSVEDSGDGEEFELKEVAKAPVEEKKDDLVIVTKEPPTPPTTPADPLRVSANMLRSDDVRNSVTSGTVPSLQSNKTHPMARSNWF